MAGQQNGDEPDAAVRLLALLEQASNAYGRADLAEHVRSLATGLAGCRGGAAREVTVAVVGEHQVGKSALVNALLGVAVSPVGRGMSTAVTVRAVAGHVLAGHLSDGRRLDLTQPTDRVAWVDHVTRSAGGGVCDVSVPSPLLDDGLVLIDMPGSSGPFGAVSQRLVALPVVDAVVMVTAITQELTADEVELVAAIRRSGRPVMVVGTKADLQSVWRRLLERDLRTAKRGDMAVVVRLEIPKKLNSAQEKLLRDYAASEQNFIMFRQRMTFADNDCNRCRLVGRPFRYEAG